MQWLLITCLAMDLAAIKSEPNLEHRSQLALDNAKTALDSARDAVTGGNAAKAEAEVNEVADSVELAYQSLLETGKDARHNSRSYKRAELATRELLRRLNGIRDSMSFANRAAVELVRDRVAKVHDELLDDLLSKRSK